MPPFYLGAAALTLFNLIPYYPMFLGISYFLPALFIVLSEANANKDHEFMISLPVTRNEVVLAKHMTTVDVELTQLAALAVVAVFAAQITPEDNAVGMDGNAAFFGFVLISLGLFNAILLPGYFTTGYHTGRPGVVAAILPVLRIFELFVAFVLGRQAPSIRSISHRRREQERAPRYLLPFRHWRTRLQRVLRYHRSPDRSPRRRGAGGSLRVSTRACCRAGRLWHESASGWSAIASDHSTGIPCSGGSGHEDVERTMTMDPQNEHPALHRDELPIDTDVVAALLRRDVPELSSLPLSLVESAGSTNSIFRLGDFLSVRLPRQVGGGEDITKEARLTPMLSAALPVTVPEVIAVGGAGFGFPENWSVNRWLPGEHPRRVTSVETHGVDRQALAEGLAAVVSALRHLEVPEHVGDELRWYRGGALSDFDPEVRRALDLCRSLEGLGLDLDKAEAVWKESLALPGAHEPGHDRWFHGDLVGENLLVTGGELSAVLDFGAVSVGDPTIDLHGAWEILDAPAREVFARRLGVDQAEWLRGRAWALGVSLTALSYYWSTTPGRRDDRFAMAHNVLSD